MENNVERQKRLISAIEQVTPLSPQIREAFLAIDRGLFVPMYYDREGSVLEWTMVTTGDAAYTDEALVTKVDSRSRHPISSSSQPSLMAVQLEALDVQPGQRILEIGTGTGYNAALLAHIVGPAGHVVSVDVDRDLVVVDVQYFNAANNFKKGETFYLHNLKAGRDVTIKTPKDEASAYATSKISLISSDAKQLYVVNDN